MRLKKYNSALIASAHFTTVAAQLKNIQSGLRKALSFVLIFELVVPGFVFAAPADDCTVNEDLPQASQKACEQIKDGLERFENSGEELGKKAAEIIEQVSTRTVQVDGNTVQNVARKSELDENNGHQPTGKAWQEYSHDSKEILNDTFIGCSEFREVVNHPEYNPLCEQLCPERVLPIPGCFCPPLLPCFNQKRIVLEHYLPVVELAANKAGDRSLDVTMFNGRDNDPQLLRQQMEQFHQQRDKEDLVQSMQRLGLDTSKIEWPDWFRPGDSADRFLQSNFEPMDDPTQGAESFPIGYQTNVHAQATRDRPVLFWLGWRLEPRSVLWCFDKPERKIVTNAADHGQGIYNLLSRAAEFTKNAWPEAYEATVKYNWNLQETGSREELPTGISPNFRAQKWSNPFSELQKVGFQPGGGANSRDWVFYGGELAPFTVARFNIYSDPVRADLFRLATSALLFGSKRGALAAANTNDRRHLQFTRYTKREGRQGYTGDEQGVREPINIVDKISLLYPPIKDGDPRTSTACFRPENVPNNEPGNQDGPNTARSSSRAMLLRTSSGHISLPKDLRTQFLRKGIEEINRANETRIAVWDKRIICACEICGVPYGCNTLNHGDFEEDQFAGNGQEFNTPPSPFKEAMQFLQGYARKQSPPQVRPPVPEPFDIPVTQDDGRTGPIRGTVPKASTNPPPFPQINPLALLPLILACLPKGQNGQGGQGIGGTSGGG